MIWAYRSVDYFHSFIPAQCSDDFSHIGAYLTIQLLLSVFGNENSGLFHEEKLKSVYRAFLRGLWKLYEFFITLDFFVL